MQMCHSRDELEQRFEQLRNLAEERDKFLDGWLRWIVSIAVGCLTVLIPLSDTASLSSRALIFFRCTCVFVGLGIIFISIRIYAFYIGKKSIVKKLAQSMETLDNKPVMSDIPAWMMNSGPLGYVFFLLGICCLIAFACCR